MSLKFSEDHEWVSRDGDIATIGITDHAQEQLGDIVYIELPDIGRTVARGDDAAIVESVKAASEVYAPVSGEIVAVNTALSDTPGLVNADPRGRGWFFRIRLSEPGELDGLMDETEYKAFTG